METKAVSWENHSSVFVFIPFLARSPISFIAWSLETFAALPGVTGCSHAGVRSQVTVGIPTRGHASGNPDWSLKEQRQSWGDAATPGHRVHTCHWMVTENTVSPNLSPTSNFGSLFLPSTSNQ